MKKWFNQMFAQPAAAATATPAAADDEGAADAAAPVAVIDTAYFRWLTAGAGYRAPDAVQARILDEMRTLSRNPGEGASLVPRVPEVIPRLLSSLQDEDVSANELSRQVAQDVLLVAEVIREANSAYYSPAMPVKSIDAAVLMLGQNGLRMLLARIAFRPVIKLQELQGEAFAKRAAPQVWSQSAKCALAASLIAPGLNAGVFEAYLAGLMQNVGLMVAFRLCGRFCEEGKIPDSSEFGIELLARGRQLSAVIATHWDFPEAVCKAIGYGNDADVDADTHADADADAPVLARVLSKADRMAKLRLLVDAYVLTEQDALAAAGLDAFQRRCLGKLKHD
jgi:HD-like signal output (HDOD) protein